MSSNAAVSPSLAADARHIVDLFRQFGRERQHQPAFEVAGDEAAALDWPSWVAQFERCAAALVAAGQAEGAMVGIMARNMPQWTIADLGILAARCVPVPLYPTSTIDQARYILADAAINLMFVGEKGQLALALALLAEGVVNQLVVLDDDVEVPADPRVRRWRDFLAMGDRSDCQQEVVARQSRLARTDLFTLIYTSGTTGEPKGVMLDMDNLLSALALHDRRVMIDSRDRSLCMLPLSHIFERCWTFYVLYRGATNIYLRDPQQAVAVMPATKPTLMCAVPRVFEKALGAIQAKVVLASPIKQWLFGWVLAMGGRRAELANRQQPASRWQRLCFAIADALVLSKIRDRFGGQIRFMPTAGARLDDGVNRYFQAIGLPLKYGYGLSETCATVSCYPDYGYEMGSIGTVLDGLEVRLGEDKEIQVRGPTIMRGYYRKPQATAEAFTADGWFRTGDAGDLDSAGNLYFTERLKELMKTSNGKYVAPQRVEGVLAQEPLIEQVAVVADARHFVSALIVPRIEAVQEQARQLGVQVQSLTELLSHPMVVKLISDRINAIQRELPNWEQVRRFTLLANPFSMEAGELTPTLKLRRKVIESHYAREIESMYAGGG